MGYILEDLESNVSGLQKVVEGKNYKANEAWEVRGIYLDKAEKAGKVAIHYWKEAEFHNDRLIIFKRLLKEKKRKAIRSSSTSTPTVVEENPLWEPYPQ